MKYILASKSPRRKQLLHRLLKKFIVESADIDESYPSNIKFSQIPISIAQKKQSQFKKDMSRIVVSLLQIQLLF